MLFQIKTIYLWLEQTDLDIIEHGFKENQA
jgi:hypothetical protein